ncbi:MAG TPA: UpxY family transcription antiterminator [Chitinophagaceae bacterium]|jgi:transcription antitermination factor NusG|nr:UpxY family transcription antiterminator [Chitinophagaceae bacterium]
MSWYALYTKSRNEKKVADLLERQGIEVYCPMQEEVRQWSDRKKKVKMPVFRSYVFVHLGHYLNESVQVLETPGAVRFLWWLGKPGIVRDEEIAVIKSFLQQYEGAEINVEYHQGDQVRIAAGPLKEQTGVIIDIKNKKAVLSISSLGIMLTAQLPLNLLKPEKPRS